MKFEYATGPIFDNLTLLYIDHCTDAVVGRYTLFVATTSSDSESGEQLCNRHKHDETFVLLFNPWHPGDAVYMKEAKERAEYVENQTTRLFIGSAKSISSRPWNVGQVLICHMRC